MNEFKYTLDNKRYHTLNYYYKNKFGSKVHKISINGGFSCPNLDGLIGTGGCIYCSKLGSGEYAGKLEDTIKVQFDNQKEMMSKKWNNSKFIVYFGTRTNTYADVDVLKSKFEPLLKEDGVIGLTISTRPDTISDEVYIYLADLNKRTNLIVELGLQTTNQKTTKLINRCHDLKSFEIALNKLRKLNIETVVHIINGLPYETKEDMINTVKYLSTKDIQGIKIHMLYVVRDTALYNLYKKQKFPILSKDEYIDIVVEQLRLLPPKIVIHRITGDPKKEDLIEPEWLLKKFILLNDIDKVMKEKDVYQGDKS